MICIISIDVLYNLRRNNDNRALLLLFNLTAVRALKKV